jgi:hypothetical protein
MVSRPANGIDKRWLIDRYLSVNMGANPALRTRSHSQHRLSRTPEAYSAKTSCSVLKVEVSVFADTAPNLFANRAWSTARI